jgi:hypothetical protein
MQVELETTPVAAIPAPVESYIPPIITEQQEAARPQVAVPTGTPAVVEPPEEAAKKPVNTWLLAGCGCIVVILLLCIALFVFIDQPWNPGGGLYCRTPFNIVFGFFGYCP